MSERSGNEPEIGKWYVCLHSAGPGWDGDRVVVIGVSREQRTARVCDDEGYETVVSWYDIELRGKR